MASTKLISPGIPNYTLKRNLQLNDKYLSNDGGDEGIRITDAGLVGVNSTVIAPTTTLEVFNPNVQYSTGTAYQSATAIVGSGTTFTTAMVGGRFVFDDGTDAGIITGFGASNVLQVSTNQTVGASDDLRSYKIYYSGVHIDVGATSTDLRVGGMLISQDEIDLSTTGDFTVDAIGDIALSADGGNITMNDGTVKIFDFDVDEAAFLIYSDEDADGARDYYRIIVGDNGATQITTHDDSSGDGASLTYNVGGYVYYGADYLLLVANTKTASGTGDTTFSIAETLNLPSGADGNDVHYGIKYTQTQTNLAGWDDVYLMYLYGGDAARTFAVRADGKVGIGVTDPASPLEIFNTASQLKISYDASNYADISVASDGHLELATTGTDGDITLDAGNDIHLEVSNVIYMSRSGATASSSFAFSGINDGATPKLTINSDANASDEFTIEVGAEGATTITTVDADTAAAHLTMNVDGHVEFDNCAVGFDKLAGTFSTSGVIGDGNDSTDIDFRLGNKYELELTNNISGSSEYINLIFPATSGNFVLVISQDGSGSRTIASAGWVVYQSDGSTKATNAAFADGTDGAIRWSGGSAPTLTTTADKADIISIYWDADNQTAFAVASLNF